MLKRLSQSSSPFSRSVTRHEATSVPPHTVSCFLKEEVWPAERLARAQLPNDASRWQTVIPIIEELKVKARKLGLWNLFLSKAFYPEHGVPLTNLEVCLRSHLSFDTHVSQYSVMAEIMGRFGHMGSEVTNCSAPDTGNMGKVSCFSRGGLSRLMPRLNIYSEVLARYGNAEQQKKWLVPLLNGEIRSAFAMTERYGAFWITDQRTARQFSPLASCIIRRHEHSNVY